MSTSEMALTQELHIVRAHHLYYTSLLEDIRKSITFIRDTPNPALESLTDTECEYNRRLMTRECANLLSEVERLEADRSMHDRRLKNVMNLVSRLLQYLSMILTRLINRCSAASISWIAGVCKI